MGANAIDYVETVLADAVRGTRVSRVCRPERAVQATEFGLVGLSGAAVNFGVFFAMVHSVPYFEAGTLAFFVAILWTFALNWTVTFERPGGLVERFAKYLGVCVVGWGIYTATLTAAVQLLALPYWLSSLGAITGGGLWNYVGSEQFALD
ncbi:GtrA family protein [Halospeciosus flavus]|uniref:GtrA family protein n=1 Tax=Halospeciosus flavus TaxID=3032283 RepID=A0ABD5Z5J4_9EURY|nr:GtrA family protein [Halospeciosus flavus]